jgi:hypothetical protein
MLFEIISKKTYKIIGQNRFFENFLFFWIFYFLKIWKKFEFFENFREKIENLKNYLDFCNIFDQKKCKFDTFLIYFAQKCRFGIFKHHSAW